MLNEKWPVVFWVSRQIKYPIHDNAYNTITMKFLNTHSYYLKAKKNNNITYIHIYMVTPLNPRSSMRP